jgi:hypothetical protein
LRREARIDAAWAGMEASLAPRWRSRGRKLLEGKYSLLVRAAVDGGRPGPSSGLARGLRRLVRRWSS